MKLRIDIERDWEPREGRVSILPKHVLFIHKYEARIYVYEDALALDIYHVLGTESSGPPFVHIKFQMNEFEKAECLDDRITLLKNIAEEIITHHHEKETNK